MGETLGSCFTSWIKNETSCFLIQFELNKKTTRFILYPAGKTTSKSFTQIKKLGFEGDIVVIPYPKKYIEETDKLLEEFVSK